MPTTTQTNRQVTTYTPAPASELEKQLQAMAASVYDQVAQSFTQNFGGFGEMLSGLTAGVGQLSPELQALVAQTQRLTGDQAIADTNRAFTIGEQQIAEAAASRGALRTSAYGNQVRQLRSDLSSEVASTVRAAQAQASNQLFQGAFQDAGLRQSGGGQGASLLLSLGNMAANPQLFRDLLNFRMATAGTTTEGTTKTKSPYDWGQLFASLGQTAGQAYGASQYGGAKA